MSVRRVVLFALVSASIAVGCTTRSSGFFTDGGAEGGSGNPFGNATKKDASKDGTATEEDASTSDASKKDSSTTSCTLEVDLGSTTCNACGEASCCEKLNACANNADCIALNDCLTACDGVADAGGCGNDCATAHPTGAQIFLAADDCLVASCQAECQ